MANYKPVLPQDIIPDGLDTTNINGKTIRKGTVAAFLANLTILEDPIASLEQKQLAKKTMEDLAPDVVAVGLCKHVTFKNAEVERMLVDLQK